MSDARHQHWLIVPEPEREKVNNEQQRNRIQDEADLAGNWASKKKTQFKLDKCYIINLEAVSQDSESTF